MSDWQPLVGVRRDGAQKIIIENHYTHTVPSGKTHWFCYGDAIVSLSIPANKNISKFVMGKPNVVWELSRLWAPDGHDRNLLTQAISACCSKIRIIEPDCEALISYADPNAGHVGHVYRAASWVPLGHSEETRMYRHKVSGAIYARRKFHSGNRALTKAAIESLGYEQIKTAGKIRFCRGLTKKAKATIRKHKARVVNAPLTKANEYAQ